MPLLAASSSSGESGRHPGLVTTSSVPAGTVSVTTTPSPPRASMTVTSAPRSRSASAAAAPEIAAPATTTRLPSYRFTRDPLPGHDKRALAERTGREELGVEDAETEGDSQPGDDPEPHDDGVLDPPGQLEVVMDRRHVEDPFAGHLEDPDLQDHR